MRNLISIDDLEIQDIEDILRRAENYYSMHQSLQNKSVVLLFFEPSTRTYLSFSMAAKKLSACVEGANIEKLALKKGESILDTIDVLKSMHIDALVLRTDISGLPELITKYYNFSVINAGDGINEHPSQALIDLYTIRKHVNQPGKILICGDLLHSRVVHSNVKLFEKLGIQYATVSPPSLYKPYNVNHYNSLADALSTEYFDAVMSIRLQKERINSGYISSDSEYFRYYGIKEEILKMSLNPNIMVMHPGPMNRNIDIADDIIDTNNERFLVFKQSSYALPIRQAIFEFLLK